MSNNLCFMNYNLQSMNHNLCFMEDTPDIQLSIWGKACSGKRTRCQIATMVQLLIPYWLYFMFFNTFSKKISLSLVHVQKKSLICNRVLPNLWFQVSENKTFYLLKSPFKLLHRKTKKEQWPYTWSMRMFCADFTIVYGGCSRPERRMAKVCAFLFV